MGNYIQITEINRIPINAINFDNRLQPMQWKLPRAGQNSLVSTGCRPGSRRTKFIWTPHSLSVIEGL